MISDIVKGFFSYTRNTILIVFISSVYKEVKQIVFNDLCFFNAQFLKNITRVSVLAFIK